MNLFYADLLKASWMAREFGVKYKTSRGQNMYYDGGLNFRTEKDCGIYGGEEYVVSSDSRAIFEPREGDLISINNGETASLIIHLEMVEAIAANKDRFAYPVKIIQRNGKAFFMPEAKGD